MRVRRTWLGIVAIMTVFLTFLAVPTGEVSAITEEKAKAKCEKWGGQWLSDKKRCAHIQSGTQKNCENQGGTWAVASNGNQKCTWKSFDDANSGSSGSNSGGDSDGGSDDEESEDDGTYTGTTVTATEYQDPCPDGVRTSILGGGECYTDDGKGSGIFDILAVVLNVMTIGVGVLGVLGIVISGIQYLTARDNEAQMAKAKQRIFEVALGLLVYAAMYALLQWLLPGGIFNGS